MWHVERLLEEAARRGDFDGGKGRAVRIDDHGPGWWVRRHVDQARQAEAVDEVVAAVERSLGSVWLLPTEQAVRQRVERLSAVLAEVGRDDVHLDADETAATWRMMARLRIKRS
jgi:hypothetical protein